MLVRASRWVVNFASAEFDLLPQWSCFLDLVYIDRHVRNGFVGDVVADHSGDGGVLGKRRLRCGEPDRNSQPQKFRNPRHFLKTEILCEKFPCDKCGYQVTPGIWGRLTVNFRPQKIGNR